MFSLNNLSILLIYLFYLNPILILIACILIAILFSMAKTKGAAKYIIGNIFCIIGEYTFLFAFEEGPISVYISSIISFFISLRGIVDAINCYKINVAKVKNEKIQKENEFERRLYRLENYIYNKKL